MASKGNWTIVFEDKIVIKNHAEGATLLQQNTMSY